jgi:hypothetical protein
MPNLQAEANQVAKDVMGHANGTITPPNDIPTPPTISSSMKTRPSPPIRTSSKTKPSEITNVMNMPVPTRRLSGRSRGLGSNIDTSAPKASNSAIDIDATPVDRHGPNERFDTESTELTSHKDTKRSDSVVHISKAETTLAKGKLKDRNASAQA